MNLDVVSYKNTDIGKMEFDFNANSLLIEFYWTNGKIKKLHLNGLVSINYRPDYTDKPPWVCLNVDIDEINSIEELKQSELLWVKGSNALKQLNFPIYRVTSESGDYYLKVVCKEIEEKRVT